MENQIKNQIICTSTHIQIAITHLNLNVPWVQDSNSMPIHLKAYSKNQFGPCITPSRFR